MLRTLVQVTDAGTARRAPLHSHRTRAQGQWNKEDKMGSVGRDAAGISEALTLELVLKG